MVKHAPPEGEGKYQCEGCGRKFFSRPYAKSHMDRCVEYEKKKAAAGTAAEENRSEQDYNPAEYFSQLKQGNFTCHEIAKAKFNGGQEVSQ